VKQRAGELAQVPARHSAIPVRFVPGRLLGRFAGLAAPWGIYVGRQVPKDALDRVLRHELVHIDQWRRLGMTRFVRRYLTEYVEGRRRGLGHDEAYARISLEKEAQLTRL